LHRRKSRRAITALCAVVTLAGLIAVTANRTVVAQAQASALDVTIVVNGAERHVRTSQTNVGATLKEAGVQFDPADLISPKPEEPVRQNLVIRVSKVEEKVVLKEEPIAFAVRRQPTTELRLGLTKVVSEGKQGLKHLYYKVQYVDGTESNRTLIRAEVSVQPQDKLIMLGERGALVSRGGFVSRRSLAMRASAYDPGPRSCGKYADGTTCTGLKAGYGVVAVDPRVIRLGTRLYIEGYGFAIAGDRGRAIKGNKIDLGFDTYREAILFGRRNVTVHILE
jgi:3D (Asp-Asp-Asp) domain-containing protein